MSEIQPGSKVRIVEDIRDDQPNANGQMAEYEGEFPLSVILKRFEKYQEFNYAQFVGIGLDKKYLHYKQARESHPEWFGKEDDPYWISYDAIYWVEIENPRFVLGDGSKIWGVECWWEPWEEGKPLEVSEKELESTKIVLRAVAQILNEEGQQ